MSKEQWLPPHAAAMVARQYSGGHAGCSIGRSEELVRAAVASGEVRTVERGVEDFSQRTGSRVKKMLFSNKDDLVDWLKRQAPAAAEPLPPSARVSPSKKRAGNKRAGGKRADEAIKALWPKGPPDQQLLPNQLLYRDVIDWIKKDCEKHRLKFFPISNDTILRAARDAGRK
jgi:hypothetical protein